MSLWIKLEIRNDGKVYVFQSENGYKYEPSSLFGHSPREALLKLADTMQRRPSHPENAR
jgi:hypothetical protein